jgi:hypothetical protein
MLLSGVLCRGGWVLGSSCEGGLALAACRVCGNCGNCLVVVVVGGFVQCCALRLWCTRCVG